MSKKLEGSVLRGMNPMKGKKIKETSESFVSPRVDIKHKDLNPASDIKIN